MPRKRKWPWKSRRSIKNTASWRLPADSCVRDWRNARRNISRQSKGSDLQMLDLLPISSNSKIPSTVSRNRSAAWESSWRTWTIPICSWTLKICIMILRLLRRSVTNSREDAPKCLCTLTSWGLNVSTRRRILSSRTLRSMNFATNWKRGGKCRIARWGKVLSVWRAVPSQPYEMSLKCWKSTQGARSRKKQSR